MNIVAAVDFSPLTDTVLAEASAQARSRQAHLWLLHVAMPEPDFVGYGPGPQSERDAVAQHLREEHRQLQTLADRLRDDGLEVTALLIQGPSAETILAEADRLDAALIVLGSHGRGALANLLVGSVCQGVLHKARCPLLVVPIAR